MKNWKKTTKAPNYGIQRFLLVMLAGYAFFFTSLIWMGETTDLIEPTVFYESIAYLDQRISLTQWRYAPKQQRMQVILETSSTEVLPTRLSFEAMERTAGTLKTEVILQETDFVVLHICEIPENWREISIRISSGETDQTAKLYTNMEAVEQVDSVLEEQEAGYRIARLEAQVRYDDLQIEEREAQIEALQKENREIEKQISDIWEGIYPSEEEARKAQERLSRAQEQAAANQTRLEALQAEIGALEERTLQLKTRIQELEP